MESIEIIKNPTIIHERTNSIPIHKNKIDRTTQYSLTQQFFDPSKGSPPNEFMRKLQMRMSLYASDRSVTSRDSE